MRSVYLHGIAILSLALAVCRCAAAQGEESVLRTTTEENHLETSTDAGQPLGGTPRRETPPGRTSDSPPARKSRQDKRRPIVPLELPEEVEEGTMEGLSLDDALPRLLAVNRDLAVKYQEIPKARADILSAGLIENPAVFLDSEGIPYGNYSKQRPGETAYGTTLIFPPLDVSGKRRKRLLVAQRAEKVLEAMYQDAVRQEIDKLYSAYLDVLEAGIKRNALRRAVARWNAMVETRRAPSERGVESPEDMSEAALRRANTEIALRDAEANLLQARRELALLLAVPADRADDLLVRGPLRDQTPPPPDTDELISLALRIRPDLAAFQLSVDHARANVQLSRAERWDDLLLFYTPYQSITFPSQGKQTATAWEAGGLAVLPIFERNQGDIARGRANVTQLQIQVRGLQEQVIYEVQRAATEYAVSHRLVQQYESEIVPRSRQRREEKQHRFTEGRESLDTFLTAEKSYDEVIQRYLEALVNHRRSMLRLNTVVGQRILP